MPRSNPLRLLILGASLVATSVLPAASEELITVVNQTASPFAIEFAGGKPASGTLTVSINGKSKVLKAWGDEVAVPARSVANVFVTRSAAGKLEHFFRLKDRLEKAVLVEASAPRAADPVKLVLPAAARFVVDQAAARIVITQEKN